MKTPSPNSNFLADCILLASINDCDQSQNTTRKRQRHSRKLGVPKNQWTSKEDELLKRLVKQFGNKAWSAISRALEGRSGKQCRDRYKNHLCPAIKKGEWSTEEDRILARKLAEVGHKWAEIAKHLPGRTDLSVKNRYYATERKLKRSLKRKRIDKHMSESIFIGQNPQEQTLSSSIPPMPITSLQLLQFQGNIRDSVIGIRSQALNNPWVCLLNPSPIFPRSAYLLKQRFERNNGFNS